MCWPGCGCWPTSLRGGTPKHTRGAISGDGGRDVYRFKVYLYNWHMLLNKLMTLYVYVGLYAFTHWLAILFQFDFRLGHILTLDLTWGYLPSFSSQNGDFRAAERTSSIHGTRSERFQPNRLQPTSARPGVPVCEPPTCERYGAIEIISFPITNYIMYGYSKR